MKDVNTSAFFDELNKIAELSQPVGASARSKLNRVPTLAKKVIPRPPVSFPGTWRAKPGAGQLNVAQMAQSLGSRVRQGARA